MSEREKAKKSIIEHLTEMENDDVLRSIIFVMGDYTVSEDGEERASYITSILFNLIYCKEIKSLSRVCSVTKAIVQIEEEGTKLNG